MIELLSRKLGTRDLPEYAELTPIPVEEGEKTYALNLEIAATESIWANR
ncbi:hypothetical protein [Pseudaminobacter soli (ex Li et al. 2025)]|nr:hypothetical protein [Mesorhizobium soli]